MGAVLSLLWAGEEKAAIDAAPPAGRSKLLSSGCSNSFPGLALPSSDWVLCPSLTSWHGRECMWVAWACLELGLGTSSKASHKAPRVEKGYQLLVTLPSWVLQGRASGSFPRSCGWTRAIAKHRLFRARKLFLLVLQCVVGHQLSCGFCIQRRWSFTLHLVVNLRHLLISVGLS